MPGSVHVVSAAERDLEAIHEYTVEEFGPTQAGRYLAGLRAAFERLAHFPRIGVEARSASGIRVWHYQRHRIVYRETPEGIVISRVLHAAREVDLILEHFAALRSDQAAAGESSPESEG